MIDIQKARECLSYDSSTGEMIWKVNIGKMKTKGKIAGFRDKKHGYWCVGFMGRIYGAHRMAWALHYGEQPPKEIDHINCIKDDNRIENLRACTRVQNQCNHRIRSDNKSGYKGVSWSVDRKKWVAMININKKQVNLGRFDKIEDAIEAVNKARSAHHKDFARYE